ncbi:hypothetical protein [Synechococcus sp. CBW1107]|uniref:hypothetical protein n=1 Tax=Synechococcus sp. CBW1107 TaxID=2789857 RepID=UPI002AD2D4E0|nr:hypothetical protein [Synechococcus sp. CBW1107]
MERFLQLLKSSPSISTHPSAIERLDAVLAGGDSAEDLSVLSRFMAIADIIKSLKTADRSRWPYPWHRPGSAISSSPVCRASTTASPMAGLDPEGEIAIHKESGLERLCG